MIGSDAEAVANMGSLISPHDHIWVFNDINLDIFYQAPVVYYFWVFWNLYAQEDPFFFLPHPLLKLSCFWIHDFPGLFGVYEIVRYELKSIGSVDNSTKKHDSEENFESSLCTSCLMIFFERQFRAIILTVLKTICLRFKIRL